jgi:RES domain-containing protein
VTERKKTERPTPGGSVPARPNPAPPTPGQTSPRAAGSAEAGQADEPLPLPRFTLVRQFDTHRLVPSKYAADGASALTRIADDDRHLRDIFDLDQATNERLQAEHDLLPGIGVHELVFGVPAAHIINAAFCHPNPLGSRFNSPERGAWYAAFELETAQAEVAYHKSVELAEVGWTREDITYDLYLADFSAQFHDLRRDGRHADCLDPDSYVASQALAHLLLDEGALGVVYPSVRRAKGTCLACFRPALVVNVRRSGTFRFQWDGGPEPTIRRVRANSGANPGGQPGGKPGPNTV